MSLHEDLKQESPYVTDDTREYWSVTAEQMAATVQDISPCGDEGPVSEDGAQAVCNLIAGHEPPHLQIAAEWVSITEPVEAPS